MLESLPFSIASVAKTLAELKKLPLDEQAHALLRRLVHLYPMLRGTGGLHKGNFLLPNDPFGLAPEFDVSENMAVRTHLLGTPWSRLVREGYLIDITGSGFFSISDEGHQWIEGNDCVQKTVPPTHPQDSQPTVERTPTAFISYSWESSEHKKWVLDLAIKLQGEHGVKIIFDQWDLYPGKDKALFMEEGISSSDFVLVVCTAEYARKSDKRSGGVGYEAMILTSQLARQIAQAKFIPVLRSGDWDISAPIWIQSKIGVDLRGDEYDDYQYELLLRTIHNAHLKPPRVAGRPTTFSPELQTEAAIENAVSTLLNNSKPAPKSSVSPTLPERTKSRNLKLPTHRVAANTSLGDISAQVIREEEAKHVGDARYNIVVLGKAGVGKSSLINYLFGKKICKTGVGKSITLPGFHPRKVLIRNIPVSLFDTAGLEAGEIDKWTKRLETELKRRSAETPVSQWFHTVLYCIGSTDERIGDFELTLIKEFIDQNHKVIIVFTKADKIAESKQLLLTKRINSGFKKGLPCVFLSSVSEKLRDVETKPFGRPELQNEIMQGFWESLSLRMPDRCMALLLTCVDVWRDKQANYIRTNAKRLGMANLESELASATNKFKADFMGEKVRAIVVKELQKAIKSYSQFSEAMSLQEASRRPRLQLRAELAPSTKKPLWERFVAFFRASEINAEINQKELIGKLDSFTDKLKDEITASRSKLARWIAEMLQQE
jgi:GTP-binding protein EngB required for normal cell division